MNIRIDKYLKGFGAFALILALVSGANAGEAPDVRDIIKESFKVRSGGTLFLDIDHGDIEILSRRGSEVLVEIERIVDEDSRADAQDAFRRHEVSFEQDGNDVHIEARQDQAKSGWGPWGGRNKLRVRVRIQVPDQYNVDFTSGAGNVTITDVNGNVSGTTGAGNMNIRAVRGPVDLRSGSGNIEIADATGEVEVSTGAGNVELRNIRGGVNVGTGAGNIIAEIISQPQGDSELHSGAGNVTVYLADRVGVYVDASASVGSLSTDFPLKVEGKWMSKSTEGRINGGGPELRLRTGVGNVSLKKR